MEKAFQCKLCGTCCYGKGGIFIKEEEIGRIATFLGVTSEAFLSEFCEKRGNRISIKAGRDNYCIFFDREMNCRIHEVKPGICFLWPFYRANLEDPDNWKAAQDACPGINPDTPFEDFVKQSKEQDSGD